MITFKFILGFLFILLVATITVLAVVTYRNSKVSNLTAVLVKRSYEVLERTDEVSCLYKEIQLESNAYFISKNSVHEGRYFSAIQTIFPLFESLRKLTSDNTSQQAKVDTLSVLVQELRVFTDSVWERKFAARSEDIITRINTNHKFRVHLHDVIDRIKRDEKFLLKMREDANAASVAAFNKTYVWLIGCISVLLGTTFFSIRYNFNKRITAETELKNANELFEKLFYESPIGIVISKESTGEILDCNKTYTELMNYSKSEMIGKTAVELGILSGIETRNEILTTAREHGKFKVVETQVHPKGRTPLWVSLSMQQIQIGEEDCLLTALLDMTSHKEAEETMKQALESEIELSKLKTNFVTLASHEFRTPLTTILSSAFLVDNYIGGDKNEKVHKHLLRIKSAVNLLTSILDEFLSITKIEEGRIEAKIETVNLKEMIESLCRNFMVLAKPNQRILYSHVGKEEISSDPVLLGNIMNNLLSNAIKYSDDSGVIVISSEVNSMIHLSVKDRGIGISPQDQEHLFERFFRASNTGNVQGTGLGLHIMKHYVEMLNGTIEVISEPGKGSEFKISLPQ